MKELADDAPVVVHVTTAPTGGGAEFLVRKLVEGLPRHGISARGLYFTNAKKAPLSENEECLQMSSPRSPLVIRPLRQYLLELSRSSKLLIVHTHLTWPFLYVPLATARIANIVLLHTEHNTQNRRRMRVWRRAERALYGRFESVVCISAGARDSLAQWLEPSEQSTEFPIIPNGSRMLHFTSRQGRNLDALRIVSVGSLTHQKGFDVAIKAIAQVHQIVDSYTIVGEGPDRNKLLSLVRAYGLDEKVRLVGWSDEVESHFRCADVSLVPSRWEGFGLACIEALSTGLPVVASNVAGLAEVVRDCIAVRTVRPEDPHALSEALVAFHADIKAGLKVGEEARRRAETFQLDPMIKSYASLYAAVKARAAKMDD